MDIQYFEERLRDLLALLHESGFPKAEVSAHSWGGQRFGVHVRATDRLASEQFYGDPADIIRNAFAHAERLITQASRNDREVAAMLGILPDGRLIPAFEEAAE